MKISIPYSQTSPIRKAKKGPGIVVYAFNTRIWETEAGSFLVFYEFESSLISKISSRAACLRKKKSEKENHNLICNQVNDT